MRRLWKGFATGLGCLVLPMIAFGGVIAWADYSVAKRDDASVAGIVVVVALVLGFALLIRVVGAILKWSRREQ